MDLGKREKPFQERFFPASPNPFTLFQTFSWHFSSLFTQKRKVPFKFRKYITTLFLFCLSTNVGNRAIKNKKPSQSMQFHAALPGF
jgi:hypothetical protein